jgi:hypothetical protein
VKWIDIGMTGAKHFVFHVFKNLKDDMKDRVVGSGISKEEWINHYTILLYREQITDTTC